MQRLPKAALSPMVPPGQLGLSRPRSSLKEFDWLNTGKTMRLTDKPDYKQLYEQSCSRNKKLEQQLDDLREKYLASLKEINELQEVKRNYEKLQLRFSNVLSVSMTKSLSHKHFSENELGSSQGEASELKDKARRILKIKVHGSGSETEKDCDSKKEKHSLKSSFGLGKYVKGKKLPDHHFRKHTPEPKHAQDNIKNSANKVQVVQEKEPRIEGFPEGSKLRQRTSKRTEENRPDRTRRQHGKMPHIPNQCLCGEKFKTASALERHFNEKIRGKIYCDYPKCKKIFTLPADAQKHKQKVHRGHCKYVCNGCKRFFPDKTELKMHRKKNRCRTVRIRVGVGHASIREPERSEYVVDMDSYSEDDE